MFVNKPCSRTWKHHHYYLNLDRCAYGGSLKLSAPVKGIANQKQVCGPIIFAVNQNCTAVYYQQEAPNEGWIRYKSVNLYSDLFKRLKCELKGDFHWYENICVKRQVLVFRSLTNVYIFELLAKSGVVA